MHSPVQSTVSLAQKKMVQSNDPMQSSVVDVICLSCTKKVAVLQEVTALGEEIVQHTTPVKQQAVLS